MALFNSHLSTTEIADLIDNLLPSHETTRARAHLFSCQRCAREFARLQKATDLMHRDDSRPAPTEAFQFAVNLFRARRADYSPRATSFKQKIVATLKSSVSTFEPAFGERSANLTGERQMLFAAGDCDIDLRIRETADATIVYGQILGDLTGKTLVEVSSGALTDAAEVNQNGEFAFPPLPFDLTDFQISLMSNQ